MARRRAALTRAAIALDGSFSTAWSAPTAVGQRELERLLAGSMSVPGRDHTTPLVAVSRSGVEKGLPVAATFGPAEIVEARASPTGRAS